MSLITQIKKKYPRPQMSPEHIADSLRGYCVGGALCRWAGIKTNYPLSEIITGAIIKLNSAVPFSLVALSFTPRLVKANDAGEFDCAWAVAEEALEYKPKED